MGIAELDILKQQFPDCAQKNLQTAFNGWKFFYYKGYRQGIEELEYF